jgi:nucleotide-binding universal stress UspA family protein
LLLAESAAARLIVVGSHGLGGLRGVLIGSVALKVAAQASCPVVVVRGSEPQLHGPVVVGVDASSESERAVGFALEAAAAREVPLVVAHAWHDEVAAAGTNPAELKAGEQRRALNDRMAGWCEKYPGVEVRLCAVRDRNAARALLRLSVDTQLIVVGSRGRGPVAGGLLGSTGNSLLRRATCPVVVVHER